MDEVAFTVNGYRTWATDAIERRPTTYQGQDTVVWEGVPSAVFTNVNVGQADIYGTNATFEARDIADQFDLRATASWNFGEDVTNGIPLRHVPPAFGNVNLRWHYDVFYANGGFWWAAAKPFDELASRGASQGRDQLYSGRHTGVAEGRH